MGCCRTRKNKIGKSKECVREIRNNREEKKVIEIHTDESASGRFKSICAISGFNDRLVELENKLKEKLNFYNLSELKFTDVRTHKPKIECAKDFISIAVDYASKQKIRIEVIIWDLYDSRHSVPGRDDKGNLERMYFHLLRNIAEKWKVFNCKFYPDEHSEYEYQKIIRYLNKTKVPRRKEPYILALFREESIPFNFIEVKQQKSEKQPLIQLADIFAGFACFSREKSDEFKIYKNQKENKKQPSLFTENIDKTELELKKANLNRFQIIEFIKESFERKGISVSLNKNNYLKTFDPAIPVNFWHYEPQGDYDKAPTKPR